MWRVNNFHKALPIRNQRRRKKVRFINNFIHKSRNRSCLTTESYRASSVVVPLSKPGILVPARPTSARASHKAFAFNVANYLNNLNLRSGRVKVRRRPSKSLPPLPRPPAPLAPKPARSPSPGSAAAAAAAAATAAAHEVSPASVIRLPPLASTARNPCPPAAPCVSPSESMEALLEDLEEEGDLPLSLRITESRSVPEMNLSLRLQGTRLAVGDRPGPDDDAPISAKSLPPRLRYSTGGFGGEEGGGARQAQFRITRLESLRQRGSNLLRPVGAPRPEFAAPLPEPLAISLPASSRMPPRRLDPSAPPCTPIRPPGLTTPPPLPQQPQTTTASLTMRPPLAVQPEVALLRGGSPGPWEAEEATRDQTLLQQVVDRASQEACGSEGPPEEPEEQPMRVVVKVGGTKRAPNKRCTAKR